MWGKEKRKRLSKSAAKGLTTLIFIVLAAQIIYFIHGKFFRGRKISEQTWAVEVDSLERSGLTTHRSDEFIGTNTRSTPVYFEFDPNTVTKDELITLGLSTRQAQSVLNYREKGGRFRQKSDFSKIYVISDSLYRLLEPYVVISHDNLVENKSATPPVSNESPDGVGSGQSARKSSSNNVPGKIVDVESVQDGRDAQNARNNGGNRNDRNNADNLNNRNSQNGRSDQSNREINRGGKIELNSADSLTLITLYGIGPYYASKILQYRKQLGSLNAPEQLMEIRGIDLERFEGLYDRIYIDSTTIKPLDIYEMSQQELASHPYIGSYAARGIIRLREIVPKEEFDPEMLVNNNILSRERFEKLKRYLF